MIILKFIIGGVIVILLDFISKSSKYYYISGLIPLFPTFALIAHFLVYKYNGFEALKETALFGLFSLLPYGGYLLSVYLLSGKINFILTIFISLIIWFILAYLVYIYFK
jgi:membrane protein GlpM